MSQAQPDTMVNEFEKKTEGDKFGDAVVKVTSAIMTHAKDLIPSPFNIIAKVVLKVWQLSAQASTNMEECCRLATRIARLNFAIITTPFGTV